MTKNNLYRKEMEKIKKEFYTWWTPENVTEYGAGVQVSKRKVWSFISQQISIAEERERERIIKEIKQLMDKKHAKRLNDNLETITGKRSCPICGCDPENQREMVLELLSHKSTKEK